MLKGNRTVRAAVLEGPGSIAVREFPYPDRASLSSGLLVKIEYAGVCGTDKHTFLGHTRQYGDTSAETSTPFPIIQGHENVGIVAEIFGRDEVCDFNGNRLRIGDRITMCPDLVCGHCWYCRNTFGYPWCEHVLGYGNAFTCADPPHLFGGWGEYMYLYPGTFVYKVPESIPPKIAALTELFTVTLGIETAKSAYSLANTGFGAFPKVLVMGTGPLGLMSIIRLRIMGAAHIIAFDKSDYRLQAAKSFGADHTVNVTRMTREERSELVREVTGGLGADITVDCANEADAFVEGIELTRRVGTVIEMGNFVDTGNVSLNVSKHICIKNIRIIGVGNHPYTEYAHVLGMFERFAQQFDFESLISDVYPLSKVREAVIKSMELESLKVLIEPGA